MEIIYAVSASLMIIEGPGKVSAILACLIPKQIIASLSLGELTLIL
jgi:hypothetical protein